MKTLKRISALLLALLLAASFSISAFAEGEDGNDNSNDGGNNNVSTTSTTDGAKGGDGGAKGGESGTKAGGDGSTFPPATIIAKDEGDHISISQNYQLQGTVNDDTINNISISSRSSDPTDLTVNGNKFSEGFEAQPTMKVAVEGDIVSSNNNALIVYAYDDQGVNAIVNGDVISNGGSTVALAYNYGSSTLDLSINGDVKSPKGTGFYASGSTVEVTGGVTSSDLSVNAYDSSKVTVGGDVKSTSGMGINAYNSSTVEVKGGVSSSDMGVNAYNNSNVTVDKDVKSNTGMGVNAYGSNVTVGGSVTSTSGMGINAYDSSGSKSTVEVLNGSVSSNSTGINANNSDVTVGGGVTSEKDGIHVNANCDVTVGGDVKSTSGKGIDANYYCKVEVTNGGVSSKQDGIDAHTSDVKVGGDVKSTSGKGIGADNSTVTVDGNVSGTTGITLSGDSTVAVGTADKGGTVTGGVDLNGASDKASLTVWKIEGDLKGSACETAINYIIRIAEDSRGKITAEDDSGASMTTAKENNTVYVTSTTGEAYNNGKKLNAGADGRFSFVVEPGGGILLSIFKKVDPKPQASSPVVAASYKLKFDFDGGVLDGETELEMKCSAGQRIKLPEAPTKEGFTFAGWQTEVRGKTVVFEAGAKYTVSAGKSFVALWEEA